MQGVEQWLPEAHSFLKNFDIVPNWRIDDLMVSYAPDGGSVGAHTDQYDVFLVQGKGRREWRVSKKPIPDADFIPDLDLRILKSFDNFDSYVLEEETSCTCP